MLFTFVVVVSPPWHSWQVVIDGSSISVAFSLFVASWHVVHSLSLCGLWLKKLFGSHFVGTWTVAISHLPVFLFSTIWWHSPHSPRPYLPCTISSAFASAHSRAAFFFSLVSGLSPISLRKVDVSSFNVFDSIKLPRSANSAYVPIIYSFAVSYTHLRAHET